MLMSDLYFGVIPTPDAHVPKNLTMHRSYAQRDNCDRPACSQGDINMKQMDEGPIEGVLIYVHF